jgi:hypothetical protein
MVEVIDMPGTLSDASVSLKSTDCSPDNPVHSSKEATASLPLSLTLKGTP